MFLASAAAVLTPAPALAQTKPAGLREAARRMALYGLPLIEMATTRERALGSGQTVNAFRHARALLTLKTQTVTQPNNDTLPPTRVRRAAPTGCPRPPAASR